MSILYIHTEHMYMHIIYTYIMQIGHNAINSAKDKILRNNNKYAVAVQSLSHVWLYVSLRTASLPVLHHLPECSQTHVHWVTDAIQPSHLLPTAPVPSIFPSIRILSNNDSALHIRWPKYWIFSFSISPCKECSSLISFRIDRFDLLASKGLLRVFSSTIVQKPFLWSNPHIHI